MPLLLGTYYDIWSTPPERSVKPFATSARVSDVAFPRNTCVKGLRASCSVGLGCRRREIYGNLFAFITFPFFRSSVFLRLFWIYVAGFPVFLYPLAREPLQCVVYLFFFLFSSFLLLFFSLFNVISWVYTKWKNINPRSFTSTFSDSWGIWE